VLSLEVSIVSNYLPLGMRLPDPFTPNLKVDLLPEIQQHPQVFSDYISSLVHCGLKQDLDAYLSGKSSHNFLNDLKTRLLLPAEKQNDLTTYNVPAINSLVFYSGIYSLNQLKGVDQASIGSFLKNIPTFDMIMRLLNDFDNEGRYYVLSGIANQLRFPNSHTHYFSCLLFQLFADSQAKIIKEQITRVLLERLIVNRPHPYGLLITFIELIRNPLYKFWDHTSFIRIAPEIERLFSSVAKSINNSFISG
jgi:CCR4-NOT transcription complex subunit 1